MRKLIPLLLVFSVALYACGGVPVSTLEPSPLGTPVSTSSSACDATADWTVQFSRSGGIAGFDQSLILQSNGNLTIQSKSPPADVQKSLSTNQLNEITNMLARACPFKMVPNQAGCADCFIYHLDVQMGGQSYVMLATDVTLTEEVRPLIDALGQLLQESGN